jgi:AGZA family xanthine/uracil permease-like MFS transporter
MMMRPVLHIDFIHFRTGMPCFVTMMMMPFTSSISEGIVLGMLAYIVVKVCIGEGKQLSPAMYVLGVLFVMKYVAPMLS